MSDSLASLTTAAAARRPRRGVLLVGHGTRNATGQAEFLETADRLGKRLPDAIVRPCFLELVSPDIPTAIDSLVSDGVQSITVAPLLLFAAGHAKRDVPAAIAAAQRRHPAIEFRMAAHLGCHPRLLALSALRFAAATRVAPAGDATNAPSRDGTPPAAPLAGRESTRAWVLVGRGSLDPTAGEETARFLAFRAEQTPVREARVGFLAMAQPSLASVIDDLGTRPYDAIVVQPHLLFAGELLGQVRREVSQAAVHFPNRHWYLTEHLGVDQAVVEAVVDRVESASEFRGAFSAASVAGERTILGGESQ